MEPAPPTVWQLPDVEAGTPPRDDAIPTWPALRALRRRWAQLLARIFEVDPLRCLRCGGSMRIIAFILEPSVINAILQHLRSKERDPRALPERERPPP